MSSHLKSQNVDTIMSDAQAHSFFQQFLGTYSMQNKIVGNEKERKEVGHVY